MTREIIWQKQPDTDNGGQTTRWTRASIEKVKFRGEIWEKNLGPYHTCSTSACQEILPTTISNIWLIPCDFFFQNESTT